MVESAKALDRAGAFLIVMECIPSPLAVEITKAVSMPTIGIGAGPDCDGQVLVTNDMLGLFEKFIPKFVKQFTQLAPQIKTALADYIKEVQDGTFPGPEHGFGMAQEELNKIKSS
jgi:3-methyl-2-oxobutanoate hydroxymethyltransferase